MVKTNDMITSLFGVKGEYIIVFSLFLLMVKHLHFQSLIYT